MDKVEKLEGFVSFDVLGRQAIGFTGTQNGMTTPQRFAVSALLATLKPITFHHGACVGSDKAAHDLAISQGLDVVLHPTDVPGKRAVCRGAKKVMPVLPPMERNDMIVASSDVLIATPRGTKEERRSGTWATIRRVRKAGIRVIIVWPDGTMTAEEGN